MYDKLKEEFGDIIDKCGITIQLPDGKEVWLPLSKIDSENPLQYLMEKETLNLGEE